MPSPTRRRVLRSSAAVAAAGFAGCLGGSDADGDPTRDATATDRAETTPGTTTDEATTEKPTTDGNAASFAVPASAVRSVADVRVGVANAVARRAVAYDSIMGSGGVLAPDGAQFVVAAVQTASGSVADAAGPPSYDAFALVADDERFPAVEIERRTRGAFTTSLAGRGDVKYDDPYANAGGESRVGWVAFEVPTPLATDAPTIRCRYGGESADWRLSEEIATALGRQPLEFELRSFSATITDERTVELSLTAENVADAAGEFLAAVYWPTSIADDDEGHFVRKSVPPNGRVEWSTTVSTEYADSTDGEVTASVEGCVSGTATVATSRATTGSSD